MTTVVRSTVLASGGRGRFQCHICGWTFDRHDEGYHHWLVCVKADIARMPMSDEYRDGQT